MKTKSTSSEMYTFGAFFNVDLRISWISITRSKKQPTCSRQFAIVPSSEYAAEYHYNELRYGLHCSVCISNVFVRFCAVLRCTNEENRPESQLYFFIVLKNTAGVPKLAQPFKT